MLRGRCRCCGCTDEDCRGCIERTGEPCGWADESRTLCTACLCDFCGSNAHPPVRSLMLSTTDEPNEGMLARVCAACSSGIVRRGRFRVGRVSGQKLGGAA